MSIREELGEAIAQYNVGATELSKSETQRLAERLEEVFGRPGAGPLWERLRKGEGIQDPSGWTRIAEFVAGAVILVVLDPQRACAFRFTTAEELVAVLGACSGFEFYVADEDGQYLLACNDHDVLIGCGTARAWVSSLRVDD